MAAKDKFKKKSRDIIPSNKNVYQLGLERTLYLFEQADRVAVAFSGGKDSTAVLHLAMKTAQLLGRPSIDVIFFDEEAIHPPTIEYVHRVAKSEGINMKWFCLPFVHRNACSNKEPFWTCWDPAKKPVWIREMPDFAISEHPRFVKGMSFQEFMLAVYTPADGNSIVLQGLRAQESLRRMRVFLRKKNDCFVSGTDLPWLKFGYPIYDWKAEDVWRVVEREKLDYNRTYDIFDKTTQHGRYNTQRVCQPFGEEPLRQLHFYAECFPETWHRLQERVHGAATAYRYANTALYGNASENPPEGMTWHDYSKVCMSFWPIEQHGHFENVIRQCHDRHTAKTAEPMPDDDFHPVSGFSWKFICQLILRGDFKGRKIGYDLQNAEKTCKKLGITPLEAAQKHGRRSYAKQRAAGRR